MFSRIFRSGPASLATRDRATATRDHPADASEAAREAERTARDDARKALAAEVKARVKDIFDVLYLQVSLDETPVNELFEHLKRFELKPGHGPLAAPPGFRDAVAPIAGGARSKFGPLIMADELGRRTTLNRMEYADLSAPREYSSPEDSGDEEVRG